MSKSSLSAAGRSLSTRSCGRPLYSSITPRRRSTVAGAGAGVFPSHILALTSPEMSHSVMSRYLLPLEEVRCVAARTSRKPSKDWFFSIEASCGCGFMPSPPPRPRPAATRASA